MRICFRSLLEFKSEHTTDTFVRANNNTYYIYIYVYILCVSNILSSMFILSYVTF